MAQQLLIELPDAHQPCEAILRAKGAILAYPQLPDIYS
jgi:hypothetical protein